jgi:hypothetical protein
VDTSNLGIGVMINMLFGKDRGAEIFAEAIGKRILGLTLKDDELHFSMEGGLKFKLRDDGQSCCETRYMTTGDNPADFVGSILSGMEILDAPNIADEDGDHEVQFLHVRTSIGTITMETHNEHNGYYGGFYIVLEKD